jgi:hypothetical protein
MPKADGLKLAPEVAQVIEVVAEIMLGDSWLKASRSRE